MKAPSLISVSDSGNCTLYKLVQDSKELFPIFVKLFGNEICNIPVQKQKALFPIAVTLSGIITSFIFYLF